LAAFFTSWLSEVRGLSQNTVRSYQHAFGLLFGYLHDEHGIRPDRVTFATMTKDIIVGYLNWLEEERGCCSKTRNQRLAALCSFGKYAMGEDPVTTMGYCAVVEGIPAKRTPKGVVPAYFSVKETEQLLALPDASRRTGYRDAVLLSVMYASGARAQEVCDLTVCDCHFGEQTTLSIHGKGRKVRQVVIQHYCAMLLKGYIERSVPNHASTEGQARHLFSSQTHEHMSISCIEAIVAKYVKAAKGLYPEQYKGTSYSPHAFRHSIAVHMLEAGVPLPVIKVFLGHSNIESTMVYATVTPELAGRYLLEKAPISGIGLTEWKRPITDALPFLLKYAD
jgi:site-specific recombinase XerD